MFRFGQWPRAPTPERVNSHAHRVTVALPCVLGGLGMSSGLGTPQVDARKKITIEESHEETELCSNMN